MSFLPALPSLSALARLGSVAGLLALAACGSTPPAPAQAAAPATGLPPVKVGIALGGGAALSALLPAWAQIWAMPRPMAPVPTTPMVGKGLFIPQL